MKILHTADWHIGKKLHQFDLKEDVDLFVDWLVDLIQDKEIDVLLISGDVFDLANPSSEARAQYYRSLIKFRQIDCKIIITGGNHDSPNMLNAPKELLNLLNIHVVGGMPENMNEQIIALPNNENPELIVAAIPFLRDADLRKANEGETYEDRIKIHQKGIENTYLSAAEYCLEKHPNIPILAMGHLYTAGATTSESERDIQMGNQAMFHATRFGNNYQYIALGHIHKPQRINNNIPTFYSGAPYPLSFSERNDEKRVLLIDTEKGFEPTSIPVPVNRKLIRIQGDLHEISLKLNSLETPYKLTSLIEIHMTEKEYSSEKVQALEDLINEFDQSGYEIIHRTIAFKNKIVGTSELYDSSQNLSELAPLDVFNKMIENHEMTEETRKEITNAFQIILEEVEQEQQD